MHRWHAPWRRDGRSVPVCPCTSPGRSSSTRRLSGIELAGVDPASRGHSWLMRRLANQLITWISAGLLGAVVFGPVGQFTVELARKAGW